MDPRNRWERFTPRLTPRVNLGFTFILFLVICALAVLSAADAAIRPLIQGWFN